MIAALLAACGPPPGIDGKVVDIWGEPIEGATIRLAGHAEQPLTDREGRFRLPPFQGSREIKVGRAGFVQDRTEWVGDGRPGRGPVFELYPQPKEYGFYLVNSGVYGRLPSTPVDAVAGPLHTISGLTTVGSVVSDSRTMRVLMHTPLSADEVARLDLELHRITFVDRSEMLGPLGPVSATIQLWTSSQEVATTIRPLRSRTDYLVTTNGPLEPGHYALQTQGLLTSGGALTLPKELRVAFPFEVR